MASHVSVRWFLGSQWGAGAILGTLPAASDEDVLVLAHRTFRQRFQSDPHVIGRMVTVNGQRATIGAVLGEDFAPQLPEWFWRPGLDRVEVDAYRGLVPLMPPVRRDLNQMVPIYLAIGQLKAGVGIDQARAQLKSIHARIQQANPEPYGLSTTVMMPLDEKLVGTSRGGAPYPVGGSPVRAADHVRQRRQSVDVTIVSTSEGNRAADVGRAAGWSGCPPTVCRRASAYALLGGVGGVLLAWWLVNVIVGIAGPAVPKTDRDNPRFDCPRICNRDVSAYCCVRWALAPPITLSRTNVQAGARMRAPVGASSSRRAPPRRPFGSHNPARVDDRCWSLAQALMLKSVWRMTAYPAGFTPERDPDAAHGVQRAGVSRGPGEAHLCGGAAGYGRGRSQVYARPN